MELFTFGPLWNENLYMWNKWQTKWF